MANIAEQYLYIHAPDPIFVARINMASVTYPVQQLVYDGVTVGSFGLIEPDMFFTLGSAEGLDDLGRGRVRAVATSNIIKIGRASQGTNDGEIDVVDNAWISIFPDWKVHAKIPFIASDGTLYKDADLPVSDRTEEPPPVANTGPGFADTIDPVTSLITAFFEGSLSIAIADGATIVGWAWDIKDGTFINGTSATDADISATFGPGFRWVALTVTDSLGHTHTARCPVFARDPANDETIPVQIESIKRSQQGGQRMSVRLLADLPRTDVPDGALIMCWEGSAEGPQLRTHMLMTGWHQSDRASVRSTETTLLRDTILECVDVAGRLDTLPGFSQSIEADSGRDTEEFPSITWAFMTLPTVDKYIHYLLQWHSTALDLADYFPSGTGSEYPFVIFESDGQTLYDQVNRRAKSFVPDHIFTCNKRGQLRVIVDPQLQNTADRTATTQASFIEQWWSDLDFTYQRPPRVHTLRGSALLTQTEWIIVEDIKTLKTPVFAIAPGTAPSQGTQEAIHGEQIAKSQDDLNDVSGHRYARMNARYGPLTFRPPLGDDQNIDPADMTWVHLVTSAETQPQRGLEFETSRALPLEVDIRFIYDNNIGIFTQEATIRLELETVGRPALTDDERSEEALPVGDTPDPIVFVPPDFDDETVYYGDMKAYILWDGANVMRTWDLQAASPTWELVDTGITGTIYEGLYVHVDAGTVGMWLLTSTAVWWCYDIMADTPAWDDVLPIATVQAADATPTTGVVEFKCMAEYATEPGYLIVATGPVDNDISYPHAYFWHTHNYGADWTQVDMDDFLEQSPFHSAPTGLRGYCHAGRFNMGIFRSSPVIWCVRNVPRASSDDHQAVFKSTDLGDTWTMEHEFPDQANNDGPGAFLIPYPSIDDPTYAIRGASTTITAYKSSDAWATGAAITIPVDYDHFGSRWRPNSHTFEPNHVMAWIEHDATGVYHLLASDDAGANWSLVYNTGLAGSANDAVFNTPNGWPSSPDVWVLVQAVGTFSGGPVIQYTDDNFATALQDKEGNLSTLLGGVWTPGLVGAFALPKISPNL